MVWNDETGGFGGRDPGDPPSGFQREQLAHWQQAQGRPGTGLIFADDLAALRSGAAASRKAAGWTPLGDKGHGWSGGYPAALLPTAGRADGAQRFASADGKAVLVVALDPPLDSGGFDALVTSLTDDHGVASFDQPSMTTGWPRSRKLACPSSSLRFFSLS